TLAGQIVMEGFLLLRIRPWLRRLVTRLAAVVPAFIVVLIAGERGAGQLLLLSQVILSMQLPFAIFPLIQFVSDKKKMGSFVPSRVTLVLAWTVGVVIAALNVWLLYQVFTG
ncbi:MAG: divalent metal cation transporter, partial [Acidobacteriota bacterium]